MHVGLQRVLRHMSGVGEEPQWVGGSSGRTGVVLVGDLLYKVYLFDGDEPDREAAALRLLERTVVPAPTLVDTGQFPEGERWLAMSRLDGTPFPLKQRDWDTPSGAAFQRQQGRLAALIQTATDLTKVNQDFALRQLRGDPRVRSGQLVVDASRQRPELRSLIESLRTLQGELVPEFDIAAAVLVHGDLGPGNILFQEAGKLERVSGVVDWETARFVDGAAEFAWPCFYAFPSGQSAFAFGFSESADLSAILPSRVAYFIIDRILEVFGTTGGRWNPGLHQRATAVAGQLLSGALPDPSRC